MDKFGLNKEDFISHREYMKEYQRLYAKTDARKKALQRYSKSAQGKESNKKAQEKFHKTAKYRETLKKWRKANPGKARADNAKRRAAKLQRTPSWADLKAIKLFYENCPKGKVVDHDIPLQGENVSGLHLLENLRYLTPTENSSKHNKYPY